MRKILIIVLIVLLLVLGYFTIFSGINVFGVDILSFSQIKDKSKELDNRLQTASTLTSVDKPSAVSNLNDSAKQLLIAKEEYNDKVLYSTDEEIEQATQGVKYEMEYLWTKVGNHATKNGITLKFTVSQSSSGISGEYDLAFVATGAYVNLSEFIASLENDSSLNFKIENAKIAPFEGSTTNLQATFNVKEIAINMGNTSNSSTSSSTDYSLDSSMEY
jgi:hypothetical protein